MMVVALALAGCAAPQPPVPPATVTAPSPVATPTSAPHTPVATATPVATWTPVVTLSPQGYFESMREAASAMRLATQVLDHADTVMTRHITDTTTSREVVSLASGDGRIILIARNVLQDYRNRGVLTPALQDALSSINSADAGFRGLIGEGMSTTEVLGLIQDAEAGLAIARQAFRQELLDHGVPTEQTDELLR